MEPLILPKGKSGSMVGKEPFFLPPWAKERNSLSSGLGIDPMAIARRHQNQWHLADSFATKTYWFLRHRIGSGMSLMSIYSRAYTDSWKELSRTDSNAPFGYSVLSLPNPFTPGPVFLAFCLLFPQKELNLVRWVRSLPLHNKESWELAWEQTKPKAGISLWDWNHLFSLSLDPPSTLTLWNSDKRWNRSP